MHFVSRQAKYLSQLPFWKASFSSSSMPCFYTAHWCILSSIDIILIFFIINHPDMIWFFLHLVEIIIFSLYHVIVRPTKIAKVWFSNLFFSVEQKCEIFLGFSLYRNQLCRRICFETFSNRYNANTVFSKNVPTLEIVLVGLIRAQGCNQW